MQGEQTGTAVPAPFGLYASTPKKCLVKDKYQAKSWYNHYQENVYTLPERIRGKQEKYQAYADRGMAALERYLQNAEQ